MAILDVNGSNLQQMFLGLQKLVGSFTTIDTNKDGVLSQDEINIWAQNIIGSNSTMSPFDSPQYSIFSSNYKTHRSDNTEENTGTNNFNQLANGDNTASSADIDALSKSISAQLPTQPVVAPESTEPEPTQVNTNSGYSSYATGQTLSDGQIPADYGTNSGGNYVQGQDGTVTFEPSDDTNTYNGTTSSDMYGMYGQPLPNAPHINGSYFNPGGSIQQVTDEELATAPPIDYNANTNSGNISKKEPYIAEQTEA